MKMLSVFFLAASVLFGSLSAWAAATPNQSIVDVSDKIQALVNKERKNYAANPKDLEEKILRVLTPVVDFEGIATAVMGKHAKQVNAAQRKKFEGVFVSTLVALYTKVLVEFEAASVELSADDKKDIDVSNTANVTMVVTSKDSKIYNINYSMRKANGEWQVRNIIADGINLGLTYRNQFDSAMNRYHNDVDAVIANWTQEMSNPALARK